MKPIEINKSKSICYDIVKTDNKNFYVRKHYNVECFLNKETTSFSKSYKLMQYSDFVISNDNQQIIKCRFLVHDLVDIYTNNNIDMFETFTQYNSLLLKILKSYSLFLIDKLKP